MANNRNQPCPCKSGLKFKKCHGDPIKIMLAKQAYEEKMKELIQNEIEKKYDSLVKGEKQNGTNDS